MQIFNKLTFKILKKIILNLHVSHCNMDDGYIHFADLNVTGVPTNDETVEPTQNS